MQRTEQLQRTNIVPWLDFAYEIGGFQALDMDEVTEFLLDQPDKDLISELFEKGRGLMAQRYARCNSGVFYVEFKNSDQEHIFPRATCDVRICRCKACVGRRKNRLYKRFAPTLAKLYNPHPRSALNLRAMTLTADLKFTSKDDVKQMFSWYREFLKLKPVKKRILSSIPAVHLDGSRIHMHIIYHGFYFPKHELSALWLQVSGFPIVDISAIKDLDQELSSNSLESFQAYNDVPAAKAEGVYRCLRYIVKYLVKPADLEHMETSDKVFLLQELYNVRLINPHGKHFRGIKDVISSSWSYVGISVDIGDPRLSSFSRNNSLENFALAASKRIGPNNLKYYIDPGGGT